MNWNFVQVHGSIGLALIEFPPVSNISARTEPPTIEVSTVIKLAYFLTCLFLVNSFSYVLAQTRETKEVEKPTSSSRLPQLDLPSEDYLAELQSSINAHQPEEQPLSKLITAETVESEEIESSSHLLIGTTYFENTFGFSVGIYESEGRFWTLSAGSNLLFDFDPELSVSVGETYNIGAFIQYTGGADLFHTNGLAIPYTGLAYYFDQSFTKTFLSDDIAGPETNRLGIPFGLAGTFSKFYYQAGALVSIDALVGEEDTLIASPNFSLGLKF